MSFNMSSSKIIFDIGVHNNVKSIQSNKLYDIFICVDLCVDFLA